MLKSPPMRLQQLSTPMVDIYYPSQFKEMSHFIDEEWITSGETSYPEYSNPFVATPATTFPATSPDTPQDPIFYRPTTSPSTYGQNVPEFLFPTFTPTSATTTRGLCIGLDSSVPLLSSNLSSPTSESIPATEHDFIGRPSENDFLGRRPIPIPIAPKPRALRQLSDSKRLRDESETVEAPVKRRRRSTSYNRGADLNEEERLLLELKEEQNLPWKEIAQRFETTFGRSFQVPALQMRFKRLRERMRTWTDSDVQALEKAHEYWQKNQFEIIASKMLEFGAGERWPPKYCEKKWQELHPESVASSLLPMPPAPQWLQDTPVSIPASMPTSVYGTPLPEHQQTPHLRSP